MMQRAGPFRAFTLIEMLVVIAIITLLISITSPQLTRSRYESRMTICLSNQHQFGNSVLAYAGDHRDALPRQDETFTTGVNTWDVSNRFPLEMGRYGMNDHRMWDCPVSPLMPTTVQSFEDALNFFKAPYGYFSIIPYTWWVPRKWGAVYFPSPAADPTCEPSGWPTHVSSPNADKQPILSDRMSKPVGQPPTPDGASGGHRWGGQLDSTTILFTDAHAERRHVSQIKRRYNGNGQNFY